MSLLREAWVFIVLTSLIAVVSAGASLAPTSVQRTLVTMLVNLVLVIGLYVFVGNSGIFSFGHLGFVAVGAYTTAIFTIPTERKVALFEEMPTALLEAHLPMVPAILVGGLIAAIVATIVGPPLMRLSGLTAALGTFAFLMIVFTVANNWSAVTNATTGLFGIPRTLGIGSALLWVVAMLAAAFLYQRTGGSLRLRASREDEASAQAAGVGIMRERSIAFVLSAFVVGVGGGILAQSLGSIQPGSFFLTKTFLIIAMLVLGGAFSLSGAVIGTITVTVISELLRNVEEGFQVGAFVISAPTGLREVGFALLLIATLALRPRGLSGGREIPLPAFVRRK